MRTSCRPDLLERLLLRLLELDAQLGVELTCGKYLKDIANG